MTTDPAGGGGDDLEGRKTRFVPRTKLAESGGEGVQPEGDRLRQGPASPLPAEEPPNALALGGTIIGRTRLVGEVGQAASGTPASPAPAPAAPAGQATMRMGASSVTAKTEYVRGENIQSDPVAGWVVVVKGPGRGGFRPVYVGMNSVGRDPSQRVSLNFGDDAISREQHAYITYDDEQRVFYVQHGGKSNLVRLGSEPVLMPTELKSGALIRIGKTTLRFVPCCGPDFSWSDEVADA